MSSRKYLLLLVCTLMIFGSCHKAPHTSNKHYDYFVVTWIGGVPLNPYQTFVSVSNTGMSYDTMHPIDYLPENISDLRFNYPMSATQFAKVKTLPDSIPTELFAHPGGMMYGRTSIDGMTTYVWYSINGVPFEWTFGDDESSSSPAVQQFYYRLANDF